MRRWLALAAALTIVAGCSEDPSSSSQTTVPATVQQPGGGFPDPAAPDPEGTVAELVVDGGACSVVVSGDRDATWEGRTDISGATYGPWIAAATQEAIGESAEPVDRSYFSATCAAGGGRQVTFAANGTIPQRPAVYRFRRDGEQQSADDVMQVLVQPFEGELWTVAESGTLTIAAFDEEHIAGDFEIVLAPLGPQRLERATITGQFDFVNTTG